MASARDRLIESAFALFEERGYDATTVDDIAERAGTGRTTFFRNFGSKEAVIFPDHEQLLNQVGNRLSAAGPESRPMAIAEAARLVLINHVQGAEQARARYRLTRTVAALRDRELAGLLQYQRTFRGFVHGWFGGGSDTALRAELIAAAVVTAHNHVLRGWLRNETENPLEQFDLAMAEVLALFFPAAVLPTAPVGDPSGTTIVVLRSQLGMEAVVPQLQRALAEGSVLRS